MKTKIKNIEYKEEKLNINFNNSQNYILGKSEKKKLLTKFFSETILNKFYNFLSRLSFFLDKNITFFIFLLIYTTLFSVYIYGFTQDLLKTLIYLSIGYLIIFFGYYFIFYKIKKNKDKFKNEQKKYILKNIKDYFFEKKGSTVLLIFIFLLLYTVIYFYIFGKIGFFLPGKINYGMISINIDNLFGIIKILGYSISLPFLLFILIKQKRIFSFKLSSLFFLPFLIIFFPLIIIYNYFYVFFTKGIKGYRFLKNKPNAKILKKFKNLEKNYAENEFYLINLKK